LTLILICGLRKIKIKTKVKGGGQECPPYTRPSERCPIPALLAQESALREAEGVGFHKSLPHEIFCLR
jgi:hypothetical protein